MLDAEDVDEALIHHDIKAGSGSKRPTQHNSFVACACLANYALGVGVLGMPYAFSQSGLVLGAVVMVVITVISIITATWLIDTAARANALMNAAVEEESAIVADPMGLRSPINAMSGEWINPLSNAAAPEFVIVTKYEVNELCHIFLGFSGKLFYELCLLFYLVGTLWLYGIVAAASLTHYVPIVGVTSSVDCIMDNQHVPAECQSAYWIWLAIVAALVVPTSCMDLTGQVILQVSTSAFRFIVSGIICVSTAIAIAYSPIVPDVAGPPYLAYTTLVDGSGFGLILTTSVFAQLVHYGIPSIMQPVRDKSKLPLIFAVGCTATMVVYLCVGIICSMYFGGYTKHIVTLSWVNWNGSFHISDSFTRDLWATVISYFVVLFPVAITTGYPLIAITLGDNLFAGLPRSCTSNKRSLRMRFLCRLLAAVPPLLAAGVMRQVGLLFQLTGLSGFFIGYIIPGFLQHYAIKACRDKWGSAGKRTPYTGHFSRPVYIWTIVVAVSLGFAFTAVELVFGAQFGF